MNRIHNKTLLLIIAALLISNLSLLALYFFGGNQSQKKTGRTDRSPVEFMVRELELNTEQSARFNTLWESTKEKNRPLYDSMKLRREELYGYLKTEPQPDSAIREVTSRMAVIEQQLSLNNYEHFRQLRSFCDARQQDKLDTLIQRMGKRNQRRR